MNRLAQWPTDSQLGGHQDEEFKVQLHSLQKERNELRSKVDAMNSKVNNETFLKKKRLGRKNNVLIPVKTTRSRKPKLRTSSFELA